MLISYCFYNIEDYCSIEGKLFSTQIQFGLPLHQCNPILVSYENKLRGLLIIANEPAERRRSAGEVAENSAA